MSTCNFCGWYGGGHSDECAKMQQRIKELEADKEAQRTKFNAEWNTLQEQINIAYKDVARLEAERDAALAWSDEDMPIPEDAEIDNWHPMENGSHETYAEALRIVGAKRSKGALVDVVNWLMSERDAAREKP